MNLERLPGILDFAGGALGWALAFTLVLLALLALTGRRPQRRDLPAIVLVLFFITLTQYPVPDPLVLHCPLPEAIPRLVPFHTVGEILYPADPPARVPLWRLDVVMNYLLCALIGLALATGGRFDWRGAALFGAGLTLGVELTQLTGAWGIFPCAYRQFDVDDLMLNFAGVMSGYAFGRWWQARR